MTLKSIEITPIIFLARRIKRRLKSLINNKKLYKVAVGGFYLESNSFVGGETTLDDFKNQTFAEGSAISRNSAGSASEFAGAWDVLIQAECELIPTLIAYSSPRPPMTKDALDTITETILNSIPTDIDGVYLMLHGSAWAHHEDDPEGVLLTKIRQKIGPNKFIAISLDLHAYFTEQMLKAVDIVSAYKTCPHLDLYETGARSAEILVQALRGEIKPKTVMAIAPMITPPEHHDHNRAPFKTLMDATRKTQSGKVLIASLLATQPWLNVPELTWKAIFTVDGDVEYGQKQAQELIDQAWALRKEFLSVTAKPVAIAFEEALAMGTPTVIADMGDATNGGSLGDSTEVLRVALASKSSGSVAVSITEPKAVLICEKSVGQKVQLTIGSGQPGSYNEKVLVNAKVIATANKKISYTHPAALDVVDDPRLSALIEVDHPTIEIYIVLHSQPVRVIDPVIYELFDLKVGEIGVLQGKSHVSFIPGFARITPRYVLADTLGPTAANLPSLPFTKRMKPLYPFEDI
jgi:microcystin degradation protein MlrC